MTRFGAGQTVTFSDRSPIRNDDIDDGVRLNYR